MEKEEVAEVSQYPIPPAFLKAFPDGFSYKTIPQRLTGIDRIVGEINREFISRKLKWLNRINEMNA